MFEYLGPARNCNLVTRETRLRQAGVHPLKIVSALTR